MQKLLSISVAAYNVEAFIEKNLQSFVDSGVLDDVEVLVVDDGSKDSTPQLVRGYADRYPDSIRLIMQENAGPGSTVNTGLANASGRYFRMVDGDDWVDPDAFSRLVGFLRESDADMVVCNHDEVDNDTNEHFLKTVTGAEPYKVMPTGEFLESLSRISMHDTVYRTDLLKENGIRLFNCFYTDAQYLYFPMLCAKTAVYLPESVYQYRVSLSTQSMSISSMQRNTEMHQRVLFSLVERYEEYLKSGTADEKVATYVADGIISVAGAQLSIFLSFAPCKERKADLYNFFARLEGASDDIYGRFCNLKTVRALKLKFTYPMVSLLHRRKLGIVK